MERSGIASVSRKKSRCRHQHSNHAFVELCDWNVIAQTGTVRLVMPERCDEAHGYSPLDILLVAIKSEGP